VWSHTSRVGARLVAAAVSAAMVFSLICIFMRLRRVIVCMHAPVLLLSSEWLSDPYLCSGGLVSVRDVSVLHAE